jgi:probable HAF family extracellular repeat protein
VLWPNGSSGGVIDLGNLGSTQFNIAFGINNRGQVVGQSGLTGDMAFHAFLWQDGAMTDLGTLPGDVYSWAETVNNQGQAVGTSFDADDNPHPFIWQKRIITDLNTLIDPNSPWVLLEALGNNDRGQIVGYGYRIDIGEVHAYVATPCDEQNGERGCEQGESATGERPRLPENVRKFLQQRWGRRHHIPGPATGPTN